MPNPKYEYVDVVVNGQKKRVRKETATRNGWSAAPSAASQPKSSASNGGDKPGLWSRIGSGMKRMLSGNPNKPAQKQANKPTAPAKPAQQRRSNGQPQKPKTQNTPWYADKSWMESYNQFPTAVSESTSPRAHTAHPNLGQRAIQRRTDEQTGKELKRRSPMGNHQMTPSQEKKYRKEHPNYKKQEKSVQKAFDDIDRKEQDKNYAKAQLKEEEAAQARVDNAMEQLFLTIDKDNTLGQIWDERDAATAEADKGVEAAFGIAPTVGARYAQAVGYQTDYNKYHDLKVISEEAWNRLGSAKQNQIINGIISYAKQNQFDGGYDKFLREQAIVAAKQELKNWDKLSKAQQNEVVNKLIPEVRKQYDGELRKEATKMARDYSNRRVYEYAVQKNYPKSAVEVFARNFLGSNMIGSLGNMTARLQAGTSSALAAQTDALERANKGHRVASILGSATGMAADPLIWMTGGAASGGTKAATWGVSKLLGQTGKAIVSKASQSVLGKMTLGATQGALNLGLYEAGNEALRQGQFGGVLTYDENGLPKIEDYSVGNVLKSAGHGAVAGALTGAFAPLYGHYGNKLVHEVTSVGGKTLIRPMVTAAGIVAEGSIFAAPDIINVASEYNKAIEDLSNPQSETYEKDEAMRAAKAEKLEAQRRDMMYDTWEDSVAFILGLKAKDVPKKLLSAGGFLFGGGRGSFAEKWGRMLDGEKFDIALTDDEKRELDEHGYGSLREIAIGALEDARRKKSGDESDSEEKNSAEYEKFTKLVEDNNVSEAARAKMIFYATGKIPPMSPVLDGNMREVKDEEGRTRYVVESVGENGIITSRTFKGKDSAEAELLNVMRSAELNTYALGDTNYANNFNTVRFYEACERVAEETGVPLEDVALTYFKGKSELTDADKALNEKVAATVKELGDDFVNSQGYRVRSLDKVREYVSDLWAGTDIEKAINKKPENRDDLDAQALQYYTKILYGVDPEAKDADVNGGVPPEGGGIPPADGVNPPEGGAPDVEGAEEVNPIDAAYQRGLNSDEQGMRDVYLEHTNNPSKETDAAWQGVVDKITEEADNRAAREREAAKQQQHTDGNYYYAELKETDEGGNKKGVFVVDGKVVMLADGKGIDREASDKSVVVFDPATGEKKMIDPSSDMGLSFVGRAETPEQRERNIQFGRDEYMREELDKARGNLTFEPGEKVTLPTGEQGEIMSARDGRALVFVERNGKEETVELTSDELQAVHNKELLDDYNRRHPKNVITQETEQPADAATETEQTVQGVSETMTPEQDAREGERTEPGTAQKGRTVTEGSPKTIETGMEITLRDSSGTDVEAVVMNRGRDVNGEFVPDPTGDYIQYFANNEVRHEPESELRKRVMAFSEESESERRDIELTPVTAKMADLTNVGEVVLRQGENGEIQTGRVVARPYDGKVEIAWDSEGRGRAVEYTEQELAEAGIRTEKAQTEYEEARAIEQVQTNEERNVRENDLNGWLQNPAVVSAMREYGKGANSVEEIVQRALADNPSDNVREALEDILRFESTRRTMEGFLERGDAEAPESVRSDGEREQQVAQDGEGVSPARQTYNEAVQKFGEKAGKKIDATVASKEKALATAKKNLDKAQDDFDNAPMDNDAKEAAALQKAQAAYDAAKAEKDKWDAVKAEHDNAVAATQPEAREEAAIMTQQSEPMATDAAAQEDLPYHKRPVKDTITKLYSRPEGGKPFTPQQVIDIIDENIKEADKEVKKYANKKPKASADPEQYRRNIAEFEAANADAEARAEYWRKVKAENERVLLLDESTELGTLEEEPFEPTTIEEHVAQAFYGGSRHNAYKITPESYRRETGYGWQEQRMNVGVIAKAENGGMTVEHCAEKIWEDLPETLQSQYDSQDVRNIILDMAQGGNLAGAVKRIIEAGRRRMRDDYESYMENMRHEYYWDKYHMETEDAIAYEEMRIPDMIDKLSGIDRAEYGRKMAEYYEEQDEVRNLAAEKETETKVESNKEGNGNTEEGYEFEREGGRSGSGSEVLPGEKPNVGNEGKVGTNVSRENGGSGSRVNTDGDVSERASGGYERVSRTDLSEYNGTEERLAAGQGQEGIVRGGAYAGLPGLVENELSRRLSERQRNLYDALAKTLGIEIEFTDGDYSGVYDNNRVRISLETAKDGRAVLSAVLAHEVTHHLKDHVGEDVWNTLEAAVRRAMGDEAFEAAVKENIEKHNNYIDELRAKGEGNGLSHLTEEGGREETVSYFFQHEALQDEASAVRFLKSLEGDRRTVSQIANAVRDFLLDLWRKLRGTGSERAVKDALDVWENACKIVGADVRERRAATEAVAEAPKSVRSDVEDGRDKVVAAQEAVDKIDAAITDARDKVEASVKDKVARVEEIYAERKKLLSEYSAKKSELLDKERALKEQYERGSEELKRQMKPLKEEAKRIKKEFEDADRVLNEEQFALQEEIKAARNSPEYTSETERLKSEYEAAREAYKNTVNDYYQSLRDLPEDARRSALADLSNTLEDFESERLLENYDAAVEARRDAISDADYEAMDKQSMADEVRRLVDALDDAIEKEEGISVAREALNDYLGHLSDAEFAALRFYMADKVEFYYGGARLGSSIREDILGDEYKRREERIARSKVSAQSVEKSASLPQVKAKAVKSFDISVAASKDKERKPVLTAVNHEGGWETATDGTILFAEKTGTRKNGLYVKDKKGKETKIEGNYPKWRSVVPSEKDVISSRVDVQALRDFLASVKGNDAKAFRDGKASVVIRTDFGDFLYDAKRLSQVADFMAKHGMNELQFGDKYGKLLVENKSAIGLVMPKYFGGDDIKDVEAFGYDIRTDKRGERFSLPERERERDDEYKRLADIVETSANPQEISSAKARMREILDEVKREKGYSDDNDYMDGHHAPGASVDTEDFRNIDTIREEVEGNSSDSNLFAIAQGVSTQPDDYFSPNGARWYMYDDDAGMESYRNLKRAIDDIQSQLSEYGVVREMPVVPVYRAVPNDILGSRFESGGQWVSPSRIYAVNHGEHRFGEGEYRIIEEQVPADELWWDGNDIREWGYDDGRFYAYKNTENNRKSDALITYDDNGNIILPSQRFNEGKSDVRFSLPNEREDKKPVFYSNAERAVEGIRQEKAKAEQWLAMIQKQGGLKAAEDKWLGLSDWLNERKGESLTKQEVLDYINSHKIEIEEIHYSDVRNADNPRMRELQKEYDAIKGAQHKTLEELEDELERFGDEMHAKYGYGWVDKLDEEVRKKYVELSQHYNLLTMAEGDAAFAEMINRYGGDDFKMAFYVDYNGHLQISDEDVAGYFLGTQPINSTRLDYTTEGLENKREIALTVPTIEPYNDSDTVHFGDAGEGRAVVWVRFGETKDADGNRVLVIDEIQSKRHQDGREKGYKSGANKTPATMSELEIDRSGDLVTVGFRGETYRFTKRTTDEEILSIINERLNDGHLGKQNDLVPDAPFDKNWHELAMKRMLRYAAENGYDKVAWTTGAQQAERYDIGNVVEDLYYKKNEDGRYTVSVTTKNVRRGNGVRYDDYGQQRFDNLDEAGLQELVGKEVATKIIEGKGRKGYTNEGESGWTTFKGKDLRIGGEGMKGFYDHILPRFMDKYGKKWRVKTGMVELPLVEKSGRTMHAVDVTPEMRESVMQGQPKFSLPEDGKLTDKEIALRDALVEKVSRAVGAERVITDVETCERVLDMLNGRARLSRGQKRALETASVSSNEEHQPTVVSNADGAKVLENLDKLAKDFENLSNRPKYFIGNVAQAIGARKFGSNSQYATFETKNGQIVTIRLADHNASTLKFDYAGKDNGISIVITPKDNLGVEKGGKAHVVEFFYDAIKLRRAEGKPLADIVRSIEQALYSGEYKDTTGLAEREEVNANDVARFHRVYHGSSADFDAFDHSHMGEGEGAQVYGWGSYVTEVEDIGRIYAEENSSADKRRADWNMTVAHTNSLRAKWDYDHATTKEERAKARAEYKKRRAEFERLRDEWLKIEDKSVLYTVEIPDDNGRNYLEYESNYSDSRKGLDVDYIVEELYTELTTNDPDGLYSNAQSRAHLKTDLENAFSDSMIGRDIYGNISAFLGGDKAASEFLHKLGFVGISYPSEYRSGGRTDGARNYVIFDESDLTIVEKARLFKTENGEAYGFTLNGKIYIDPRIATAETPVHEYHHLWAEALEKSNPDAWTHLKSELYKDADLVSWVKERYPDLAGDENGLAHELFAKFGGKRGAERLREEQAKAEAENKDGIIGKARIIAMFNRFKDMLSKYWQMARDVFAGNNTRLNDMSANDFADMAMADLMKEVKPRDDAATQTQHTETRFSLASETEDVPRGDQLFLFDDGRMESSGRRYSLTKEDRKVSSAHDAMSRKGLREIVGKEGYDAFLDDVGRRLRDEVKGEVSSSAGRVFLDDILGDGAKTEGGERMSYDERRRAAVGNLLGELADKPFEDFTERDMDLWQKAKAAAREALGGYKTLPDWFELGDNELRYMLWRTKEGIGEGRMNLIDVARDIAMRDNLGLNEDNAQRFSLLDGTLHEPSEGDLARGRETKAVEEREDKSLADILKDQSLGLRERITAAAAMIANSHQGDAAKLHEATQAINSNLSSLRKAMTAQRIYDKTTVKRVADLARVLISGGYLDNITSGQIKRLLSAVKSSAGRESIDGNVQKIMDIMIDNQLKQGEVALHKLETIKGSKVDAKGVEVQGKLDPEGVRIMNTFKKARKWDKTDIEESIADAQDRISSDNKVTADNASSELAGLQLALQYADNIKSSKVGEQKLRDEIRRQEERIYDFEEVEKTDANGKVVKATTKTLKPEFKGAITEENRQIKESVLQSVSAMQDAIRQGKIDRAQGYRDLVGRLSGTLGESMEKAQEFRDAEQQRIQEIHHNANSDMKGRPSNEHYKPPFASKAKNVFANSLLAPLSTFEQFMRMLGSKSANGEGYLYNRFVRQWVDARQKEITGIRDKFATLDAKAEEIFNGKVKSWGELIRFVGKLPKGKVSFMNGGEMREAEINQGNLMYIYMVNKMLDGKMKLRSMGITEEDVANIEQALDPRLIRLADWLQDEFLVSTREEYNETHKRMFGASMAAIEDYFPLKILANARTDKAEDLDNPNQGKGISTSTGSIVKRTRNNSALDITNANALNVVLDHITEMEHWNAFAEFKRDINTLRTYKRFRNQIKNMDTAYGNGEKLWQRFNDLCQMATGDYIPPRAALDEAMVNIAKGVTAAKVSFRVFTALKQFLSSPAYLSEARIDYLAKNLLNPYNAWRWSMENLPIFRERWQGRTAGDPRLAKSDKDWSVWRSRIVELASRYGMAPNAFVDALTVSIGAHSIYQTKRGRYLREGYSEAEADKRAIQDAEIAYNQTQQSSESIFLSPMQVDRSWAAVTFTIFRNASMAYERQLLDALRNTRNNLNFKKREERIEFMKKQYMRDGISEAQAEKNARRKYSRQILKDAIRIGVFGYVMQFAWNLGAYLPYIIFGDDDDVKSKYWDDVLTHSKFGSIEGLTAGDAISSTLNLLAGEDKLTRSKVENAMSKEMPFTSDAINTMVNFATGKYAEGINDMVNLAVQAGFGVNPQSITDALLAVADACGDDPALTHEATICIARILQIPQSQLDNLYFDELGLKGNEVSKYSIGQLAERYAKYRAKRGTFAAAWAWNDEGYLQKGRDRAVNIIIDRIGSVSDDNLEKLYNSADDAAKKVVSKEVAKRSGLDKERYTNAKTDYGKTYAKLRNYVDLAEDVLLQSAKKEAKNNGNKELEKEINSIQNEITKMQKQFGEGDDNSVLQDIRSYRKERIAELGLN